MLRNSGCSPITYRAMPAMVRRGYCGAEIGFPRLPGHGDRLFGSTEKVPYNGGFVLIGETLGRTRYISPGQHGCV